MFKYRLFGEKRKNLLRDRLAMPRPAKILFSVLQIALGVHFLGIVFFDQEIPITYGLFLLVFLSYLASIASSAQRLKRISAQINIRKQAKRFWPVHNLVLLYIASRLSEEERERWPLSYVFLRISDFVLICSVLAVIPHFSKYLFRKVVVFQYIYYRFFEG